MNTKFRFHITTKSGNSKTDNIMVISSSKNTCSYNCPFKNNGCYGDYSWSCNKWNKISDGKWGTTWTGFKKYFKTHKPKGLIRLWDIGDFPGDKRLLDQRKCETIADMLCSKNSKPFAYTHYDPLLDHNKTVIQSMLDKGLTVNISTQYNNVDHVSDNCDFPIVCVVPSIDTKTTPKGKPIFMCPAFKNPKITCKKCGLCAKKNRKYIIGFIPHGTGKNIVRRIITKTLTENTCSL